jgi:hypothetical protein
VVWYAGLGLTAAVLTAAAVIAAVRLRYRDSRLREFRSGHRTLLVAGAATVGWLVVTAVAAPLNFSQLDAGGDIVALARIFDRFEVLNLLRAGLQLLALATLAGALAVRRKAGPAPDRACSPGWEAACSRGR